MRVWKNKYMTEVLWDDLISLGKSNGLNDKQIEDRLVHLEVGWQESTRKNTLLEAMSKENAIISRS